MNATLIFLDLETTGLDPIKSEILEIAMVSTDRYGLKKHRTFTAVANVKDAYYGTMDDWCQQTHTKSGLIQDVKDSRLEIHQIDKMAAEFVWTDYPKGHAILVGNSIQFDRKFIDLHMPLLSRLLHHRMIDVSGMREAFKLTRNIHLRNISSSHRALPDVLDSIALYQALMTHVR